MRVRSGIGGSQVGVTLVVRISEVRTSLLGSAMVGVTKEISAHGVLGDGEALIDGCVIQTVGTSAFVGPAVGAGPAAKGSLVCLAGRPLMHFIRDPCRP